ncbi:helix-turn-helix domain-containing protein [Terriglobus sp. TAA 43]|uniref:helix-turn-helix domain-containing protein n=1 Tax=Terriglobus sp. TAA 43 TaxID=278961 RepID=UPI00068C22A7|nr:helix-turn-helix transcriptional regulator [Terriglobus sp. TAA 43]
MNNIEKLRASVIKDHPDALTKIDQPSRAEGMWSLEIELRDICLVIEWSIATGFGITTKNIETFGETADEQISSLSKATDRVRMLLDSNEHTSPPLPVLLARLRERRGLTQRGLAEILGVRQSTISGIEHREDIQLSTLQRIADALGGSLSIAMSFSDSRHEVLLASGHASVTAVNARRDSCRSSRREVSDSTDFSRLRESGTLERATQIARTISDRHCVIEMPQ